MRAMQQVLEAGVCGDRADRDSWVGTGEPDKAGASRHRRCHACRLTHGPRSGRRGGTQPTAGRAPPARGRALGRGPGGASDLSAGLAGHVPQRAGTCTVPREAGHHHPAARSSSAASRLGRHRGHRVEPGGAEPRARGSRGREAGPALRRPGPARSRVQHHALHPVPHGERGLRRGPLQRARGGQVGGPAGARVRAGAPAAEGAGRGRHHPGLQFWAAGSAGGEHGPSDAEHASPLSASFGGAVLVVCSRRPSRVAPRTSHSTPYWWRSSSECRRVS
mmetsp:Transcript_35384/g.101650  ORF Transcript_35384/g.101650 Transcript_35384/m.101650 type:complete len:277 (+) Transcript_35384:782-1612(+)